MTPSQARWQLTEQGNAYLTSMLQAREFGGDDRPEIWQRIEVLSLVDPRRTLDDVLRDALSDEECREAGCTEPVVKAILATAMQGGLMERLAPPPTAELPYGLSDEIVFDCPHAGCGKTDIRCPSSAAGRRGRCPRCKQPVRVPPA